MACLSASFPVVTPGRIHRSFLAKRGPNAETPSSSTSTSTSSFPPKNTASIAPATATKLNAEKESNESDVHHSRASRLQTATTIAQEWIQDFSDALSDGRIDDVVDLFVDDPEGENDEPVPVREGQSQKSFPPFWRDMVAYTWNIITLEGKESIRDMLEQTRGDDTKISTTTWDLAKARPSGRDYFPPPLKIIVDGDSSLYEFWCDITTSDGTGYAHVRLDAKTKRATTVLTTLLDLHDRPFQTDDRRSRGSTPGPVPGRKYFDKKQKRGDEDDTYHVAIVGAGQAGLSLAARLEAMEVPYILFEAGHSPGSSWRHARYPSLHLHDPVWYQHMPYMEFPKTWPVFTPKDKIADWLDAYATLMDLNLRTNTKVVKVTRTSHVNGSKDEMWQIKTVSTGSSNSRNNNQNEVGEESSRQQPVIHAKHIVFATGNSSRPKVPNFPGASSIFRGIQLHTSQYTGGKAFAGKNIVVIGSNNSGFDICQDLWEQGAGSVTMIQRTASMIVSSQSVLEHGLFLFNEDPQYHHEDADLILTTTPYRILVDGGGWKAVTNRMKENDQDLISRVEAAGYKFDYGYKGTGVFAKSATEGGGFYIDVGCAELLARQDVKVRYSTIERFESDAVVILHKHNSGGEERVPADVVVYATGFDTMESYVEQICGKEILNQVGKVSKKFFLLPAGSNLYHIMFCL